MLTVRIIFLNSWFAKTGQKYFNFIENESSKTDIFCLTEVQPDLFLKHRSVLIEHNGSYITDNVVENLGHIYGQAIFFKKGIDLLSSEKVDLYRNNARNTGFLQNVDLEIDKKVLSVGSVHGKPRPGSKLDTPIRIKQSQKIIDFLDNKKHPKIVGGDFNLKPDTKSVKMFEDAGYRNLIKDFNIKETRNHLNWDHFPDEERQHFADYCFVSSDIKVLNFEVPNVEVSDHEPLILDFEI